MLKYIFWRMPFYYAVPKGRKPGIFGTWSECEQQVKGFSGAVFKKFKTQQEAESFMQQKHQNKGTFSFPKSAECSKRSVESQDEQEQREIEEILREALEREEMLPPKKKPKLQDESDERTIDARHVPKSLPDVNTKLKKYGDYYFHEDSNGFVQVFTDGSCENNGKKHAIAGLGVYFGDDHPLNASEPVIGKATNNIGEIKASIKAISEAQQCGILRLNIFTDSQFLINSVCKWMTKWKSNNWTLATGKPVANQEDFKVLDKLINSGNMVIKWSYIPAHRGHIGNEEADRLAKEGARKQPAY